MTVSQPLTKELTRSPLSTPHENVHGRHGYWFHYLKRRPLVKSAKSLSASPCRSLTSPSILGIISGDSVGDSSRSTGFRVGKNCSICDLASDRDIHSASTKTTGTSGSLESVSTTPSFRRFQPASTTDLHYSSTHMAVVRIPRRLTAISTNLPRPAVSEKAKVHIIPAMV